MSKISKFFSNISHRQKNIQDRDVLNPQREWVWGVVTTIIGVCIGGVAGYVLYTRVGLQETTAPTSPEVVLFNRQAIDEAVEIFSARAATYNTLDISRAELVPLDEEEVVPSDTSVIGSQEESISPDTENRAVVNTASTTELDVQISLPQVPTLGV